MLKKLQLSMPQNLIINMELFNEELNNSITLGLVFLKEVDIEILKKATKIILEENEIFRYRMVRNEGVYKQEILDTCEFELTLIHIQEEECEEWQDKFIHKKIQLNDSLFEIVFVQGENLRFYCKMHHLICDAWSMNLFCTWVLDLYVFMTQNREITHTSYTYTKFLEHEEQYRKSNRYEKDQQYFIDKYECMDEPVYLGNYNKLSRTLISQRYEVHIDEIKADIIRNFCVENKISMYGLMVSAFAVYLNKYRKKDSFFIGTSIYNRCSYSDKNTLGMFVNTIPIFMRIDKNESLGRNLKNLARQANEAVRHQKFNYGDLLKSIRKRDNFKEKLFDVSINYQNRKFEYGENMVSHQWYFTNYQTDALSIHIRDWGKEIWFDYDYQEEQFEESEIAKIHEYLMYIVEKFINSKETNMDEFDLVLPGDKDMVLYSFNETREELNPKENIVSLFEEQSTKFMNCPAVRCSGKEITYGDLNKKSNQLAYILMEKGVKKNTYVIITSEKSIETIIGILSILKVGAIYIPVDPNFPKDRIHHIAEESCPSAVLVSYSQFEYEFNCPVIDLNNDQNFQGEVSNIGLDIDIHDLAYVIYTSGTSGKPKGALLEHEGVVNLKHYFENELAVTNKDVVLQFASLVFDGSIWEIYMALLNGACLCMEDTKKLSDVNYFNEFIRENKITLMALPPRFALEVENYGVRVFITAGSEAIQSFILRESKKSIYINSYGPTEVTVCATQWKCDKFQDVPQEIPIGKPICNKQVYILNGNGLCGVHMPGELCVAGAGIARGYLNMPELTKKKFIKNPYGEGRLYRTGDVAYWTKDGNIRYLGRIDQQVKVRGYRIELGEVETCMRSFEHIKDVVVIAKKDINNNNFLNAFFVSEYIINVNEIKNYLRGKLPEYMVPLNIMQIDRVPVNRSGKVEISKLPEIVYHMAKTYTEPRNKVEKTLVECFERVLEIEKMGVKESFSDFGGDSIKAIRIVSYMKEKGYRITVGSIMEKDIIEEIAHTVKEQSYSHQNTQISGYILPTPIVHEFFSMNYANEDQFNQTIILKSKEKVDEQLLIQTLEEVCAYHDALRMIQSEEGLFIRDIKDGEYYFYAHDDLSKCKKSEIKKEIEKISYNSQNFFHIKTGPLMNVRNITALDESYILIVIHHLAIDGVSWRVLVEDLDKIYTSLIKSQPISLPLKMDSLISWGEKLTRYAESNELKQQLKYWNHVDEEVEQYNIPTEKNDFGEYLCIKLIFSNELSEKLIKKVKENHGFHIRDLLLLALTNAVMRWNGQEILALELEGHGREEIDSEAAVERTLGWFTSVYPMILNAEKNLSDNLNSIRCKLKAIPGNGMGYGVLKYISKEISLKEKPRLLFNYLGEFSTNNNHYKSLKIINFLNQNNIANNNIIGNDIVFDILLNDKMFEGNVRFHSGKFYSSSIYKLNELFLNIIDEICEYDFIQENNKVDELLSIIEDYNQNTINQEIERYETPYSLNAFYLEDPKNIIPEKKGISANSKEELYRSLRKMIRCQEIFRTAYDKEKNQYVVYAYKDNWKIPYFDFDETDMDYKEAYKNIQIRMGTDRKYHQNELLHQMFVAKKNNKYILLMFLHHCLWDRTSSELFLSVLEELKQKYVESKNVNYFSMLNKRGRVHQASEEIVNWNCMYQQLVKEFQESLQGVDICALQVKKKVNEKQKELFLKDPFYYITRIMNSFIGIKSKKTPIMIIGHGRNQHNSNILGLCLELEPKIILENGGEDTCIQMLKNDITNDLLSNFCLSLIEKQGKSLAVINYVTSFDNSNQNRIKNEEFQRIIEYPNPFFIAVEIRDNFFRGMFPCARQKAQIGFDLIDGVLNGEWG